MTTNLDDKVYNQTILNQKLTPRQNAYMNYLIPSIISFIIYTLLLASEAAVIFRHYCDGNVIWASLTISFLFLPALGCYIFTISDWDLWPHNDGWSRDNIKWFFLKTLQHLLFPIWVVWRYAERIFWSIEAVRHTDPERIKEGISFVSAPRNVELYLFLASFLQSLPQMLFQLALLIRSTEDTKKYTVDAQILSCVFNLTKLSATIAYYHRFKSQKYTGRQYPWLKEYKKFYYKEKKQDFNDEVNAPEPELNTELINEENTDRNSRRSSGSSYLEPVAPSPKTLKKLSFVGDDENKREVNKESVDEPDFNIKRLLNVMGLPDDDVVGKLIAFFWWFTFLLARIFAISAMAYFYLGPTIYLLLAHFVLVEAYLLYDVKTDDLKHSKILFFIFIGFVYIFCIIEFKIRFKKASFIYYGFFMLVYAENFTMCIVWMTKNVQDLENDFWFRYMFYIISMCFVLGISSMIFYFNINKPKKIVVKKIVANS